MQKILSVGQSVAGSPGDTFVFMPPSASVQYHFQVSAAVPALVIGVWKGSAVKGNGVARNKPNVDYVDHVCGAGTFIITVEGMTTDYLISAKANSWWKKVFGWG